MTSTAATISNHNRTVVTRVTKGVVELYYTPIKQHVLAHNTGRTGLEGVRYQAAHPGITAR